MKTMNLEAVEVSVPKEYTTDFTVSESGYLNVPVPVREDHLTPETEDAKCVCHAAGEALHLYVHSPRDTVLITLPLRDLRVGNPYLRSMTRWRVNVSRWSDSMEVSPDGTVEARVKRVTDKRMKGKVLEALNE